MSDAERCPSCGGAFHCGARGPAPCPCTGPRLDAELQRRLRERYSGCLCIGCLRAVAEGHALDPVDPRRTAGG